MRLFIWEGNGISGAWHDDGVLVVLAESPEHAREIVRNAVNARDEWDKNHQEEKQEWYRIGERAWMLEHNVQYGQWETEGGKELSAIRKTFEYLNDTSMLPDGDPTAIDREPDRVLELVPQIVAFNGGGYD